MKRLVELWRDTRHLWVLLALIVLIITGGLQLRERMVPATFGQTGPYRAAALDEIAAKPSVLYADATCLKCHADVGDERAEALHKTVRCVHCHGLAHEHVAIARKAADASGTRIPPAADWDGNVASNVDFFITKDRAICLSCHESAVGQPASFKKIDVAKHLEEQGAAEPQSKETCFECHGGHNTAP